MNLAVKSNAHMPDGFDAQNFMGREWKRLYETDDGSSMDLFAQNRGDSHHLMVPALRRHGFLPPKFFPSSGS
jgi:hypothetical protein